MPEIYAISILAGFATCFGALIVLLFGRPTDKSLALFLGLAVGIMLAVVAIDLIPAAFLYGDIITVLAGIVVGLALLSIIDFLLKMITIVPNKVGDNKKFINMGLLIALGIALHDLPEGIAIAAGYEANPGLGYIIALAIGMHNIPEGMAVAAPLRMGGVSKLAVLAIVGVISIFTPLGAYLGVILTGISPDWLALLLAMAGGAMLYVVFFELILESLNRDVLYATLGGILGITIIMFLTIAG